MSDTEHKLEVNVWYRMAPNASSTLGFIERVESLE